MADKAITPEDQRLLVEASERIATITLNRPEARNAMTKRMRNDLCAALRASDADDEVDAVILTGADPVFTGGVDLRHRRLRDRPALSPIAELPRIIQPMGLDQRASRAGRFKQALLAGSDVAVIAEIKRRSPSRGDLNADLDPAEMAVA